MFSKWGQCIFHLWILCTVSWLLLFERHFGPPCIIFDDKLLCHVLLSTTRSFFSKVSFASSPADTYIGFKSLKSSFAECLLTYHLCLYVWWFKIVWPKWLLSIIGLTIYAIKQHRAPLEILCVRLLAHFHVVTVSKDPLLCALNKQRLFVAELPEL